LTTQSVAHAQMNKKIFVDKWNKLSIEARLLLIYLYYQNNQSGIIKVDSRELNYLLFNNESKAADALFELSTELKNYLTITKLEIYYFVKIKKFDYEKDKSSKYVPVHKEPYEKLMSFSTRPSTKILFWTLNFLSRPAEFKENKDHLEIIIKADKVKVKKLPFSAFKDLKFNLNLPFDFKLETDSKYRFRVCEATKEEIIEAFGKSPSTYKLGMRQLIENKMLYILEDVIVLYV
jgi:hypothetical protein